MFNFLSLFANVFEFTLEKNFVVKFPGETHEKRFHNEHEAREAFRLKNRDNYPTEVHPIRFGIREWK